MPEPQLHLQQDDLLLFANRTLDGESLARAVLHLSSCRRCRLALIEAEAMLDALAPRTVDRSVLRNRYVLAEPHPLAPTPEEIYMAVLRKLINRLRRLEI